jgi:hypothetical protein
MVISKNGKFSEIGFQFKPSQITKNLEQNVELSSYILRYTAERLRVLPPHVMTWCFVFSIKFKHFLFKQQISGDKLS